MDPVAYLNEIYQKIESDLHLKRMPKEMKIDIFIVEAEDHNPRIDDAVIRKFLNAHTFT